MRSTLLSFIDPDAKGKFVEEEISFEGKDLEFMAGLIRETYARIQQHEFYQGCGDPGCTWCGFIKEQNQLTELSDRTAEEMDDH